MFLFEQHNKTNIYTGKAIAYCKQIVNQSGVKIEVSDDMYGFYEALGILVELVRKKRGEDPRSILQQAFDIARELSEIHFRDPDLAIITIPFYTFLGYYPLNEQKMRQFYYTLLPYLSKIKNVHPCKYYSSRGIKLTQLLPVMYSFTKKLKLEKRLHTKSVTGGEYTDYVDYFRKTVGVKVHNEIGWGYIKSDRPLKEFFNIPFQGKYLVLSEINISDEYAAIADLLILHWGLKDHYEPYLLLDVKTHSYLEYSQHGIKYQLMSFREFSSTINSSKNSQSIRQVEIYRDQIERIYQRECQRKCTIGTGIITLDAFEYEKEKLVRSIIYNTLEDAIRSGTYILSEEYNIAITIIRPAHKLQLREYPKKQMIDPIKTDEQYYYSINGDFREIFRYLSQNGILRICDLSNTLQYDTQLAGIKHEFSDDGIIYGLHIKRIQQEHIDTSESIILDIATRLELTNDEGYLLKPIRATYSLPEITTDLTGKWFTYDPDDEVYTDLEELDVPSTFIDLSINRSFEPQVIIPDMFSIIPQTQLEYFEVADPFEVLEQKVKLIIDAVLGKKKYHSFNIRSDHEDLERIQRGEDIFNLQEVLNHEIIRASYITKLRKEYRRNHDWIIMQLNIIKLLRGWDDIIISKLYWFFVEDHVQAIKGRYYMKIQPRLFRHVYHLVETAPVFYPQSIKNYYELNTDEYSVIILDKQIGLYREGKTIDPRDISFINTSTFDVKEGRVVEIESKKLLVLDRVYEIHTGYKKGSLVIKRSHSNFSVDEFPFIPQSKLEVLNQMKEILARIYPDISLEQPRVGIDNEKLLIFERNNVIEQFIPIGDDCVDIEQLEKFMEECVRYNHYADYHLLVRQTWKWKQRIQNHKQSCHDCGEPIDTRFNQISLEKKLGKYHLVLEYSEADLVLKQVLYKGDGYSLQELLGEILESDEPDLLLTYFGVEMHVRKSDLLDDLQRLYNKLKLIIQSH
ncbi:MAG: hypothetical protein INQ03_09420 [Candidatus Heimdallarchaeota archaeon]|nr:hypothetical protein [Candidatus Heimdallarchaeota archaeon]